MFSMCAPHTYINVVFCNGSAIGPLVGAQTITNAMVPRSPIAAYVISPPIHKTIAKRMVSALGPLVDAQWFRDRLL